jgi:hypothetical protein
MTITDTLNKTAGRFTTLVVSKGSTNTSFCARINSATAKTVRFYDVNTGANRVVPTNSIVFARSGSTQYRKPVSK